MMFVLSQCNGNIHWNIRGRVLFMMMMPFIVLTETKHGKGLGRWRTGKIKINFVVNLPSFSQVRLPPSPKTAYTERNRV